MHIRVLFTAACLGALVLPAAAFGADHANLDEGRPVRFEDPYPIPRGEWALEVGGGARESSFDGGTDPFFPVEILFGAALNTQIKISTELASESPRSNLGDSASVSLGPAGEPSESLHLGDVRLSALYNFNQETTAIPALGVTYSIILPTGRDSHGLDAVVKALMTKSISRLSFHVNASELFVGERSPFERGSRFELDAGTSFPFAGGTRMLLLLGIYAQQAPVRGVDRVTGLELGLRRQQTARMVLDVAVGTESGGGDSASRGRIHGGISWSY